MRPEAVATIHQISALVQDGDAHVGGTNEEIGAWFKDRWAVLRAALCGSIPSISMLDGATEISRRLHEERERIYEQTEEAMDELTAAGIPEVDEALQQQHGPECDCEGELSLLQRVKLACDIIRGQGVDVSAGAADMAMKFMRTAGLNPARAKILKRARAGTRILLIVSDDASTPVPEPVRH